MTMWFTQRRRWFGIPYVRITRGSVVRRHVFGVTHGHAERRADRWIAGRGTP